MNTERELFYPALFTVGNNNGRDIRMGSHPDRPPLIELPATQDARIASLLIRTEKEVVQSYDNYEYPVYVMDSRMVNYVADGVGNEIYLMEVIALGDHTPNGVGSIIPKEKTWNGNEPETRLYVRSSSTPWSRERMRVNLLSNRNEDHKQAFRIAERLQSDEKQKQRVAEIISRGNEYLKRSLSTFAPDDTIFSLTGD